jgi:hypothetical protein
MRPVDRAQSAFCAASNGVRGGGLKGDFFFAGNELQMLRDKVGRNAVKIEPLAPTEDGRQNFLRLGRGENEFHMRRRFFERFQ